MGRALEVITGRVANPGATITALTANAGDSFQVRSHPFENPAWLANLWVQQGTVGIYRVRSPRLHDQAQGIRLANPEADMPKPLLPLGNRQKLFPQDTLTVELSGSAAATDVGALMLYYGDLPGIDARLETWEGIRDRIVHTIGVEQNITTGATAGQWDSVQQITTDFDNVKADTDYAVLGYLVQDNDVAAVAIQGVDTGNLRIGGPGSLRAEITRQWFIDLSMALAMPCIPILNSDNMDGTSLWTVNATASQAVDITLILAELA